ncbi:hypothetical protein [Pseudoalteromonas byunsanensis]|uniref:Uncharacterized protein n=1 Tax=Pseudoalteromonas byunsanensis TaxID=327939 RepID=A0A1S1N9N8_9GAMM|nr:hypothetical protein [Pseudoalteromonas byunsanensis]OHU96378.1 hypothetical protein BIW53_07505 [Pseudoalteromonas byunsanensis]
MDINIFAMVRDGSISPLLFWSIISVIIALPIQLLIAKLKGFRLMPALISGCIPILNLHIMLGYILMAVFYRKPREKELEE